MKYSLFNSIGMLYSFSFLISLLGFLPSFSARANPISLQSEAPSNVLQQDYRSRTFRDIRPQWGLELTSSLHAFGGRALTPSQGANQAYAFSMVAEYQPTFIQSLGVLGFGPSVAVYPILKGNSTPSAISLLAAGGQVRYQARYFYEQPLVPIVGYSFEYMKYQFLDRTSGGIYSNGPTLGLWLFLNSLDSPAATQLYMNTRILRTYLILEGRYMTGKDANLTLAGTSYYFGLRFEF